MLVALVLTVLSMLDYFSKARHLLGIGHGAKEEAPAPQGLAGSDELRRENERKAEALLGAAREAGATLGTAESLTGGLIAGTLTAVPGSSDVVAGGVVSYGYGVKERLLEVDGEALSRNGAVTREVACQMVEGARASLDTTVAVSATGIAGPGGAEPGKPVGTVWIGTATSEGSSAERFCFEGDREQVRLQTVGAALDALLSALRR